MTQSGGNLTIEHIEKWVKQQEGLPIDYRGICVMAIAFQLADTMRENERLKQELHQYRMIYNPMGHDITTQYQIKQGEQR